MSSLNTFFIRRVTDDAISVVHATFPAVEIQTTSEFIRTTLDIPAQTLEQNLMELSSRLETDVMWLTYQSVVDAFEYYHWQAGTLLRALVYGCYVEERTWERVEGQPEPWEKAVFFSPEALASILEDEESEDEKQRLAQFWQNGELITGRTEPYLSAQRCAFQVASYYRFPGWEL